MRCMQWVQELQRKFLLRNIKPGAFVQIGTDNNDLNEETLDDKNTTHATTMVIYQNKMFGPDPSPPQ